MIKFVMKEIKHEFPIFQRHKTLVYLDNAATTQKPRKVIDSITKFYSFENSNVFRGFYPLAEKATLKYEKARKKIAKFINANEDEIIFVPSATYGLNGIATSLAASRLLSNSPKILVTDFDHHSNILPWQKLYNVHLDFLPLDKTFAVKHETAGKEYDVVSVSHVSNVTGAIIDLQKINVKSKFTVIDATQSAAHIKIDVKKLNVDFAVFSGHKMYAPMGIGFIYGKRELLEKMEPFSFGGGMVSKVNKEKSTWTEVPGKFEAGTPNVAGGIALGEAVDFIEEIGFAKIEEHERKLRLYALEKLGELKDLQIFHPSSNTKAVGVISFIHNKIHAHDIADYLGQRDICVRAGHHCTQILHRDIFHVPASVRISFGIYNTFQDIDVFIQNLKEAIKFFSD
ncbi:MAG: cysteine desulfurase [Candidatus Dojkabacteria bacterium]